MRETEHRVQYSDLLAADPAMSFFVVVDMPPNRKYSFIHKQVKVPIAQH